MKRLILITGGIAILLAGIFLFILLYWGNLAQDDYSDPDGQTTPPPLGVETLDE